MKNTLLFHLLIYFSICAFSQSKIDSLNKELGKAKGIMKVPVYMEIANEYSLQGDFKNTLEFNLKALSAAKKTRYKDFHSMCYDVVGGSYEMLHEYEKAIEMYQLAIKAEKQLKKPNQNYIANDYGSIAYSYRQLQQSENAMEYYKKSISLYTEIGDNENAAYNINQLGLVYADIGDYTKAKEFYNKALKIYKLIGNESGIAIVYHNLASIHYTNREYEEAMSLFKQALAINTKNYSHRSITSNLSSIANIYRHYEEYDKAIEYLEKAIKINEENGNFDKLADAYTDLASVYFEQMKTYKAIAYYTRAIELHKKNNDLKAVAHSTHQLAMAYWRDADDVNSTKYFNEAINIYEEIRSNAPLKLRREYLAKILSIYNVLYSTYLENDMFSDAFAVVEQSRSRVLYEQLAKKDKNVKFLSLESLQNQFESITCVISYTISINDITILFIDNNETFYYEVDLKDFLYEAIEFQPIKSGIASILNTEDLIDFKKFVNKEEIREVDNLYVPYFNALISYYRKLLTELTPRNKPIIEKIAQLLFEHLIAPVNDRIANKSELIIIPDGILGYLPFETLLNAEKKYLVENHDIRYTQSLTILETIKQREYKHKEENILAIGGAVHNEKSYNQDMALVDWNSFPEKDLTKGAIGKSLNENQLLEIQNEVDIAIQEKRGISNEFKKLGYGKWSNLSGSLLELKEMSEILPNTRIIKGYDVNESNIKNLSRNGELNKYAIIHFSTHGITIPEIPEMSSLVLNQYDDITKQNKEDGYLRMGEIEELELKADFVNLSACETGLGKIYGGEGVVGLTQSFLIAGANSISVSLWEVADQSTAKFMVEVYKIVKEENIEYNQAINKVKRKFINGDFGFVWKNPYYWAPFVFYGN